MGSQGRLPEAGVRDKSERVKSWGSVWAMGMSWIKAWQRRKG
jgi:hypothetical protein